MQSIKLQKISKIYNGNSINAKTKKEKYMNIQQGWNYIGTKDIDFDGHVTYKNGVVIPFFETRFKTAPSDTVFVCAEGGSAGRKTAYITEEVCFGNKLYAIVNDRNLFYSKYLFYFTRSNLFFEQFKGLMNGIIGGVSTKKFGEIIIPIPDIDEQKRIVAKIEELFSNLNASVVELQLAKEKLELYRQAVLKEAFEGKYEYPNRKFNRNFEQLPIKIVEKLPDIPAEWIYVPLSKLGILERGRSKHRPRNDKKLFIDGKYPFFQTGDIKSAENYVTKYSSMYGDFGLAQSKLWPKGTLCITIAANIAETAFLGIDGCFPDSVVGFVAKEGVIDSKYVRYFIESSKVKLSAFAPATAQKNINLKILENMVIPYCSIEEQNFITEEIELKLTWFFNIERILKETEKKILMLRHSILKQAFEGKL